MVQTGRAQIISFKWLLPLTGLRATESCFDRRVFGVITIVSMLMSTVLGLAAAVFSLRGANFACSVIATG